MAEIKYDIINIYNDIQYIIQKKKNYQEISIKEKLKNNKFKRILITIFTNKNINYEKYEQYFYEDNHLEIINPIVYIETIDVILNSNRIDVLQSKFLILKIILDLYQSNIKNYFDKIILIKICNMKLEYVINNIRYNINNINNKCKYCNKKYDKKSSLLSHEYRKHKNKKIVI
jgi:hypothetical protein